MRELSVLNVDDDDAARYIKTRILERAGHKVIEAASAGRALAQIAEELPQVVVLDVKLPDMSGFEVTRRIRADPRCSALPIIQVSAICVTSDDEDDGLASGADAFLPVPFDPEMLVYVVERVFCLRDRGAEAEDGARKLAPRVLWKVRALIEERLTAPLSVKDLAAAAGLSEFYFARVFKAATGETPHALVVRMRIEKAMRLMRETAFPLREIAAQVGYRTHSHFSTAFRRLTGMPPGKYRENHESRSGRTVGREQPLAVLNRIVPVPSNRVALIIDDDAAARYVIRHMINGSMRFEEASDGPSGLALAAQLRPGVIFLDLLMPGMQGDEVLDRLRADPATAQIPVIIVTSKDVDAHLRDRLSGAVRGIVQKRELSVVVMARALEEVGVLASVP